ncbi:hypothetical protein TSOC_001708 [Tetrabaena socialis]|uniref:Uncharacterized protein n=1 Tax=Tetrabaena socialis TaxID=47790 RepID=A0A2J8AG16_9CHLO|nr:hypothetical protein TSOC_001708 [Tetrabaena socialis]|eukprot:PNH11436.1 hypothetical protein TSOC_001708 [Tetrabaena socialis]
MIDLAALKEQLKLLGHNLPDAQVIAILKDMNITYDGDDGDDDGQRSVRAAYGGSHAAASSSARGSDFSPKGVKGAGVGGGASRHAWAEPSSQPADSNTPVPSGSGRGNASDGIDAQMARSLERLALARHGRGGQMPAAGGRVVNAAGVSTSKAPSTVFGSQQQQQKQQPPPSSASRVRDQAPKDAFLQRDAALPSSRSGQARPLYDDESDSSTRSLASRASASSRGGGRGAKKVDRVQRYHQMQAEWSQSRFLKQAGGQPARGTNRKPVNFHSHFAAMHAAEDAGRQRLLRETRAKTKQDLGAAVDAPTANRRDELRWQTRMRMQEQT